jgi:glycosyltransferase involved in cell wall biosynthesis
MRTYPTWKDRNCLIVPPWDLRPIQRVTPENNRFIEKYALKDKKIALYAGNLGEGHTFDPLVKAARTLAENRRDDWKLVFVIRGSKKQRLIDATKGLPSVVILDYQPVEWTSDLLSAATAHLITINDQSKGLVVPSKLYGVLQTEAPVLFIGPPDADTAREIERYRVGETLDGHCRGAEVVAALDRLYNQRDAIHAGRLPADTTGPAQIAAFITREQA